MSHADDLIKRFMETIDNDTELDRIANDMVSELRRLAEIELKYNDIMAQEPIGKISHLDRRNYGGKISYLVEFHSKDRLIVGTELYTLPRTSHD